MSPEKNPTATTPQPQVRERINALPAWQKAKQLSLTDDQKSQLREKESTEENSIESTFLKMYNEVWLPKLNGAGLGVESIAVGGRQLTIRLDDQKKARVHDRVMELAHPSPPSCVHHSSTK